MVQNALLRRLCDYLIELYHEHPELRNKSWDSAIKEGLDPITDLIPYLPIEVTGCKEMNVGDKQFVNITYLTDHDGRARCYTVYEPLQDLLRKL